jgi:O-glycosyl hydrolase
MPDSTAHAFSYTRELSGTIATIKAFRKYQPHGLVLMTAFSPPASLRVNKSTLGSGDHNNSITDYPAYANWWLSSMNYYAAQGALPDAITIQNEPDITSKSYENCYFTPAAYGSALDATCKLLARQTNPAIKSMRFFGPEVCITQNLRPYMAAPTVEDVSAISHHFYGDTSDTACQTIESDYNWWTWKKFETENSGTGFVPAAGQPKYLGLATDIYKCMAIEETNSYLIWDLAWQIDTMHYTPIQYTYEAYMLGHYSEFLHAGDWRIYESNSNTSLLCTAYRHDLNNGDKRRLVMVMLNASSKPLEVQLNLAGFWANEPAHCFYNVYQTTPSANMVHITTDSGRKAQGQGNPVVSLPGYSVTTVIQN